MVRKHIKVEPQRWFYWADKLGLLVWQDMPLDGHRQDAGRRRAHPVGGGVDARSSTSTAAHRPSSPGSTQNEGWGQYDQARIADRSRRRTPPGWSTT